MFGAYVPRYCITFVSQVALDRNVQVAYELKKRIEAVKGTRHIGKKDMKYNDATPQVEVDPETYQVKANGVHCTAEPLSELPLTQEYFLF